MRTHAQVKDEATRRQLVSRCLLKTYQPRSGADAADAVSPAMGLLVPVTAAAAAAAGDPLPDAADPASLEGEYSWDAEYAFELTQVRLGTGARALAHSKGGLSEGGKGWGWGMGVE